MRYSKSDQKRVGYSVWSGQVTNYTERSRCGVQQKVYFLAGELGPYCFFSNRCVTWKILLTVLFLSCPDRRLESSSTPVLNSSL